MEKAKMVFVVTCYQNVVGVFASQDDAVQCQRDLILKNRLSSIIATDLVEPLNSKK